MRELVILVADGTMKAVFDAFFGRQRWDLTLQCRAFDIWPQEDIFYDPMERDGGVYRRAHELLRPYLRTHRRALVVLDQQFGGERPAGEVGSEILSRLRQNGWEDRCEVVVIDPELEVWLLQDKSHVKRAVKFSGASIRAHLEEMGNWPGDAAKPLAPKEALQALIRPHRALKTKVVYSRIARAVSVSGCEDPAFLSFSETIRRWFPPEVS
ncbi:MAG TPA: hypothetical protein VGG06_29350 [Thermoanaerobaculia bacterium]